MTEKAHAVHIDRRHQSAPKETDADKAVRLAAEEIHDGKWMPARDAMLEMDQVPDVALRAGTGDEITRPWTMQDFRNTDESLLLGEHPRVKEALAKLEQEKVESKSGQEYVEKAAMLHELLENSKQGQKWEGQHRWQGKDNEEMRHGEILTPMQFYDRLMRALGVDGVLSETRDFPVQHTEWADDVETVKGKPKMVRVLKSETRYIRTIGRGRILLTRDVSKRNPWDKSGRVALVTMGPGAVKVLIPGQQDSKQDEPQQIATLQWPAGTEWMIMNFDEFGVPTTQKYIGWRTALLTLIRSGVITEQEAHKAFPVGSGPAANWYRQQVFEWSNGAGRVQ
jgi:hypothetical protein